MSRYNFYILQNRRGTRSYKWDCSKEEISLSIADMDFPVMPEIKEAIRKRSEVDSYGYSMASDRYFEAYKNWFGTRYNSHFEKEDCIFSSGIVASLDSVIKRITKEDEGVLLMTPVYNVFFNIIKNNHRRLVDCPFIYKDYKYEIDWNLLEEKLKESKALIFCNPHNPIGKRYSKEEIEKIVSLCRKYDVFLLSDEIHCDIDYNSDRYVSILSASDYDKLITFLSPGKTFNVAGLQSSIMVIKNHELRELIQKGVYEDDIGEPNYFAIDPVIAAYENGESYVCELNNSLSDNRKLFSYYLKDNLPHLHLINNEATYLLWIDISYYSKPSDIFVKELKECTGLIVCGGDIYGDSRFIRVNIATSKEVINDALKRLHKYISKLEKEN